ncbi:LysR substrate-binding domain-containing protein [Rhodovarius crocodyli]|uniref:LysR substrate-binding domain-containing protein n=1 Tax=Rhodovarius crocodyli TaxID=1979269 RepID=UPI001F0C00EB|nr:LysR substrate-binding domain-containing protein [Rhodovarius crocodyli]
MVRRLPSLNGIRAFEAAARLGGFAAAAEELHVSPAAVSRLVRLLEERLGVPLFDRAPNRLLLTPAGAHFHPGLTQMLDRLSALTDEVRELAGAQVVTLGVGPTFAIRWLIPRLGGLQRALPGVELRITTGGETVPFSEAWSAGVRLGEGEWPGLEATPLFPADLLPVMSPALAARLTEPGELARQNLLRVAHGPEDWGLWSRAAGLPALRAHGPVFEYYGQALQAALDGLGVAMGIRPYVDDDLAAGRLVAPFPLAVPKGKGWYLVYRPSRLAEPGFLAFRDWLLGEAQGIVQPSTFAGSAHSGQRLRTTSPAGS